MPMFPSTRTVLELNIGDILVISNNPSMPSWYPDDQWIGIIGIVVEKSQEPVLSFLEDRYQVRIYKVRPDFSLDYCPQYFWMPRYEYRTNSTLYTHSGYNIYEFRMATEIMERFGFGS